MGVDTASTPESDNRIELVIGDLFELNIGTDAATGNNTTGNNSSPLQKHR